MNFYKSKAWRGKRTKVLRRDEYACQECKRYGKSRTATTVHHVNPLESYPQWRLESWNLLSLCNTCHEKMHDRTGDVLTPLGEYWRERVSEGNKGIPPPLTALKTSQEDRRGGAFPIERP